MMIDGVRARPQRLKGFPDFLPNEALVRWHIITTAVKTARLAGFALIDTPTLEYYRTLSDSDDDEQSKQIYRFRDKGDRDVGLRFDLTVPFSRFVAEHRNELTFPFRRLQFGNVFRGEKPQRGRYREFQQCDLDIVGCDTIAADVETIALFRSILSALGVEGFTIAIGHRQVLTAVIARVYPHLKTTQIAEVLIVIDKLNKIGEGKVSELLVEKTAGTIAQAEQLLTVLQGGLEVCANFLEQANPATEHIARLQKTHATLTSIEANIGSKTVVDLTIARGLDYYTGIVFETTIDAQPALGSVCSGGRYDNLMNRFSQLPCSGVGGSIGVDRLTSYLQENRAADLSSQTVYVASTGDDLIGYVFEIVQTLRASGIATGCDVSGKSLKNQLKHAHRGGYPLTIIIGKDENCDRTITLRTMQLGTEEKNIPFTSIITKVNRALQKAGSSARL